MDSKQVKLLEPGENIIGNDLIKTLGILSTAFIPSPSIPDVKHFPDSLKPL